MEQYRYSGLNGLTKELNSTAVISQEYRGAIMSWVLLAVREAYDHGVADQKDRHGVE
jgi:hypothetical protein